MCWAVLVDVHATDNGLLDGLNNVASAIFAASSMVAANGSPHVDEVRQVRVVAYKRGVRYHV